MTTTKDTTRRIVGAPLLATAQRWLETAAALLHGNAQAAGRCIETAAQIQAAVQHGPMPNLPEDHSDVFGLFEAAQKASRAGRAKLVLPGLAYVEEFDFFLIGKTSDSLGGRKGENLEDALAAAVSTCQGLGVTATSLDKAYSAVRGARFTMSYNRELARQEAS